MPAADRRHEPINSLEAAPYETHVFSAPEVMVKFKTGVTEDAISTITQGLHDRVDDEIESVPGLDAIDDLDDANAESVAAQYRALPQVEYAEAVFEISADDAPVTPRDPRFAEQWALFNDGSRGGIKGADISAMHAWHVTTGSDNVVVAVLDSGVDYTHSDLASNIWVRPANVNPYEDKDLGTIQDVQGYNAVENNADPYGRQRPWHTLRWHHWRRRRKRHRYRRGELEGSDHAAEVYECRRIRDD